MHSFIRRRSTAAANAELDNLNDGDDANAEDEDDEDDDEFIPRGQSAHAASGGKPKGGRPR